MLYCDAATFCRRRNDAGIMTDETGRRCAQESIDIIIMKNNYNYLFIIKIILITYLGLVFCSKCHDTDESKRKTIFFFSISRCDYWRKAVRQKCFFCVIFVNGIYLGAESCQLFSCLKCQAFPCCIIGWGISTGCIATGLLV